MRNIVFKTGSLALIWPVNQTGGSLLGYNNINANILLRIYCTYLHER